MRFSYLEEIMKQSRRDCAAITSKPRTCSDRHQYRLIFHLNLSLVRKIWLSWLISL